MSLDRSPSFDGLLLWIFDFNSFWRENDVIRLTERINFDLWHNKLKLLKLKCEKIICEA